MSLAPADSKRWIELKSSVLQRTISIRIDSCLQAARTGAHSSELEIFDLPMRRPNRLESKSEISERGRSSFINSKCGRGMPDRIRRLVHGAKVHPRQIFADDAQRK